MRVVMPAKAGIIRFARHKLLAFNAKIALSVAFFFQEKALDSHFHGSDEVF